ncbi:MAG: hypothetical protein M3406_03625 [Chloroflexota bacterium]|nr:hypothetical protein [Chloroflexota bacterium]
MELLGTSEATTAVMALLSGGVDGFTASVNDMTAAATDGAYTAGVFAIQTETTAFALQQLSASATDFRIAIGSALQPVVTPGIEALSSTLQTLTSAFEALPGPAQSAVVGMAGLTSVTALAAGGFLILLPRIVETRAALQTLGGASGIVSSLGGRIAALGAVFNPLTIGIGAAAAAGYVLFQNWQEGKQAADEFRASISTLETTLEMLRRQGDTALADLGESTKSMVNDMATAQRTVENMGVMFTPGSEQAQALDEQARAIDLLQDKASLATPVLAKLNEALNDPNIDADAYLEWASGLITAAAATQDATDDVAALQTIMDTPLSDFSRAATEGLEVLNTTLEETMATAEKVSAIFDSIPTAMDELRIEGGDEIAAQIEEITTAFERMTAVGTGSEMGHALFAGYSESLTSMSDLTESEAARLEGSFDRIIDKMSSGEFDNPAIMESLYAIFSDPSLSPEQRIGEIEALSNSMADYSLALTAMEEAQRTAFTDFLSNGDNVLDFWLAFSQQTGTGAAGIAEVTTELQAAHVAANAMHAVLDTEFTAIVGLADDLDDAGRALDSVLTTFGQIDALGQRSASAGSIADNLIGEPGVWAAIDDLLASSFISLEQYNDAVAAGTSIQQSNAHVQADLNAMRAQQLPLLASEQAAYEEQIHAISQLGPLEQRRALALQDSAVQAQLATQYATAYSASVGEIPEEVATQMIVSAAEADPVIKDLLLNMGLIEEGADGEIRVNFPDGDTVQESVMALTDSIDRLYLLLGGDPAELRVEADTADAEEGLTSLQQLLIDLGVLRPEDIHIGADTADAEAGIGNVHQLLVDLGVLRPQDIHIGAVDEATPIVESLLGVLGDADGTTATATINATDNASPVVSSAQAVISALSGKSVTLVATDGVTGPADTAKSSVDSLTGKTVSLNATDNASGAVSAAQRMINSLSGKTVTNTIITKFQTIGSPALRGRFDRDAHGGVPTFASGGMVPFWAGENGPEVAHFAGGGSALLPHEGLYAAPPMTYISPNNAVSNSYGGDTHGDTYELHVHGNVYGIDDLADAMEGALVQRRRGFGSRVTA